MKFRTDDGTIFITHKAEGPRNWVGVFRNGRNSGDLVYRNGNHHIDYFDLQEVLNVLSNNWGYVKITKKEALEINPNCLKNNF